MKEKSRKKRSRSSSRHRRKRSRSKEKKSRSKSKTRNDRNDRSRELKRNRSVSKERGSEKRKNSRSKSRKKRKRSSSSSSSDEEKRRHNRRNGSRETKRKSKNKKSQKNKSKTSQEYSNSDDDVEIIKEPDRKPELERGLLFKNLIKHPVKEKSQEAAPEQQHYPVPAPSSDSGFGAFTSTIFAPEPEPEPAPKSIPKPVPKLTPVPTLSLFCNLCQFKSEDRMAREEHMTEPHHQKNMLRMGEVISEFIKKHKNLNKLINIKSTYWKPEKENKPEVGKMPAERAKEPEPDVIVVMEAEAEIKVLDPRKAPFLYTSHLMVCFDVKLTDASVASEIYQIGARTATSQFSTYLLPQGKINWDVTELVGIKVRETAGGQGGKKLVDCTAGSGLENEVEIPSQLPWYGFSSFLDWIEQQKDKGDFSKVVMVSHSKDCMPALLNKLATDSLVSRLQELVDCFTTYQPYLRRHHPNLGDQLTLEVLSPKLLPGQAFTPHHALDDARKLFLILQKLGKEDVVGKVLEKNFPMEKALEICRSILSKAMEKNSKRQGKNRSMALIMKGL